MTHEISGDANTPSNKAAQDFSALADQWFDKNWYLPPEGDQSWREREARRLFGDGKDAAGEEDLSAIEQPDPAVDETAAPYGSGLHRSKARTAILPIALAACVVLFGGTVLVSKILAPGIWGPEEPKVVSVVPARLTTQVATEENARLRPAYEGGTNHVTYNDVSQALPQPIGEAAMPVDQDIALPLPRPAVNQEQPVGKPAVRAAKALPVATKQDPPVSKPVVRAAKTQPLPAVRSKARAAKSLPPIGEAYFARRAASGAAEKPIAVSGRPIGQAYFESRSPVAN